MKITTLIENKVYQQGLHAEHGLSIYIETADRKIIFDTGQSDLFIQNSQKMGIAIEDIDCVVLSHGHYDHTGGLYPFLELNRKAKVFAKRNIFIPRYSDGNRFIGTPDSVELFKDRIVYVDTLTEIATDVFIIPEITIHHNIDTHFDGLTRKVDNELIPDEFDDELFLVIKQKDQIHILTGCSHRGITNICATAIGQFKLPVGLILGGFHLKNCSDEQYRHIIRYFTNLKPKSVGVCHCTGLEKSSDMIRDLKSDIFYNFTGNEILTE